MSIHTDRNEAAAVYRAESGTLPTAGQQSYATPIVPYKLGYGQILLTGPVMAATNGEQYAFADALTSEMKGLVTDTAKRTNQQLHGFGVDTLATHVSGASSTSVVVDDGIDHAFTYLPAGKARTVDLLDVSASYAALNTAITITRGAANAGNTAYAATLSSAASASAADGDVYVVSGSQSGLTGYSLMGIGGIIDNVDPPLLAGGLHGITVAAEPGWAAQVIGADNTLVDISFPLIQQGLSELASNTDFTESDVAFFLMGFPVRNKFVELCTNERAWMNTMTIDGGFEAVTYNGKAWVPDNDCRRGRFYAIVPETMKFFTMNDWDWVDQGGVLIRQSGLTKDVYGATLRRYWDLGTPIRSGNVVYKGIRE